MLTEDQATARLTGGEFAFPPLQIITATVQPTLSGGVRPDWILVLGWLDERREFAVEYKSLSTPKRLQEAIRQAAHVAKETGLLPMVMAPYLDEQALESLADQNVSGLDFSGNGVVVVPGSWLVYRTGSPNAYPATAYIKSIYNGRSSLVARTLLLQRKFETVTAIREEIERREGQISLPTVSKVLKRLEEELIVSREDGVVVVQPDRLLDELTEAYEPPRITRQASYHAADLSALTKVWAQQIDSLSLRAAARGEQLYTLFPGSERTLTVYAEDLAPLADTPLLEETRRFSNVQLMETREETVYFDRRKQEDFYWTSPVQVYLELATGGKREQEVAEDLRAALLNGEYS